MKVNKMEENNPMLCLYSQVMILKDLFDSYLCSDPLDTISECSLINRAIGQHMAQRVSWKDMHPEKCDGDTMEKLALLDAYIFYGDIEKSLVEYSIPLDTVDVNEIYKKFAEEMSYKFGYNLEKLMEVIDK